jgi:hypothetical protein
MNMDFRLSQDFQRTSTRVSRVRAQNIEPQWGTFALFGKGIGAAFIVGAATYVAATASLVTLLCVGGAVVLLLGIATAVCIHAMNVTR